MYALASVAYSVYAQSLNATSMRLCVQRLSLSLNLQNSGSMNKEQGHSFRRQVLRRGWGDGGGASRSIKGESSSAVWSNVIVPPLLWQG